MKGQYAGIFALVFVFIVAAFAVINVDPVQVNYFFGSSDIPLILVILFSALLGGLIVGSFSLIRSYKGQRTKTNVKRPNVTPVAGHQLNDHKSNKDSSKENDPSVKNK
ncbi:DUF1049 domain-containing protein [Bacillaceae bacterium SIJ1]|uniref:LapA family protein n=1 Tax=Litoribacterium kuwaitense TaxID=1398745 RepID=UPI0013ECBEB8|nr:lipopolysaccharide assembly protein LapA domain-containing protein [Litoribacterium kuwaitense]NGP43440.1 DUF1049 domain-containing protein [Litoribacterium kuwaitense]